MTVRDVEWKKPYTGWKAISIDENKVVSLNLRDENNLIIYDEGDDEIYVDLQLPDWIRPLDAFPVGVTTGRVLVADDWDTTWTIVCFKTTSWDNIKLLYADDGKLYIDNWTWTFKQIYLKGEVDALLQALRDYTDAQLALKQDKLTAWNGISIDNNNEISNTLPWPIVSSSAPLDPVEWDQWYDTTNDVLKIYDGTNWNEVWGGWWDVNWPNGSTNNNIAVFDWTTWKIIKDSGKALNNYLAKDNTSSFTPSANYNPATKKYVDDNTSNKASNTDLYNVHRTDYSGLQSFIAWNGIFLKDKSVNHKITQWPCPDWYYIPSENDWNSLRNKLYQMGINTPTMNRVNYLLMPLMGHLDKETWEPVGVDDNSSQWGYQTSSVYFPITNTNSWCQVLWFRNANPTTDYPYVWWAYRWDAYPIRPFKTETVIPDSTWTQLYDASTLGTGAWIYHNATLWLISIWDTSTAYPRYWMTIADKNLWATVAYHYGDTKSETNCGLYYQWGNNYGNPFTWASSTTTNLQETYDKNGSNSFYYNKFVITSWDWSKLRNDKLWGALNTYAIENQFQVFELNDVLDLDGATKLYNHLRNGRIGFLKFSLYKTIYIPYYVSNTEVKFYAINGFGAVNSWTRCQFRGYKFTINNSVVTSISVNNNSIEISSSTPTQPGNDTITLVI